MTKQIDFGPLEKFQKDYEKAWLEFDQSAGEMFKALDEAVIMAPAPPKEVLNRDTVLKPSGQEMRPVTETVFYQADFVTYLKEKFEGLTIAAVSKIIDVPEQQIVNVLTGVWKPSREMAIKLGLRTVYAIPGTQSKVSKPRRKGAKK